MVSALLNATGSRTLSARKSVRPPANASTICFWQPRGNRHVARCREQGHRNIHDPRLGAFGRSGPWGSRAPGMMGTVNMAGLMNRPLADVLQQLERDFGQAAHQARGHRGHRHQHDNDSHGRRGLMRLPVDMIETDDAVWYFVDVPGLEKSELQIQVNGQDRSITIKGERSPPDIGEDNARETRLQRKFGKFSHTIDLPKDCDEQLISAKVDKGVLRIKVLKSSEIEPEIQTVRID